MNTPPNLTTAVTALVPDAEHGPLVAALLRLTRHGSMYPLTTRAQAIAAAGIATQPAAILRALTTTDPALLHEDGALLRACEQWQDLGVALDLVATATYPQALVSRWPDLGSPTLLARRGMPVLAGPAVAIIGTRRASTYGYSIAHELARDIAGAGVSIVSGGAVGVDAAAHRGALDGGGHTAVVLACGHGVQYPSDHARPNGLFHDVLAAGGTLLSEVLPRVSPVPQHILARNRIVAGLADAVVVVEGQTRSGTLRTAAMAADLGIPILAVPGDVRAPGSAAPNRLLREGAVPVESAADVLAQLPGAHDVTPEAEREVPPAPPGMPRELAEILRDAWPRPIPRDLVLQRSPLTVAQTLAALTRAVVAGQIVEESDGCRLAHHGCRALTG